MKVTRIETLRCDAGWRMFSFLKVMTDEGIVGWSEYNESFGSHGLSGVIEALSPTVIGKDPRDIELINAHLRTHTVQSRGGINRQATAAIENALLDIKGKALGVPVYQLFGGKIRDRIPVYWSHCGSYRMRNSVLVGEPAVTTYDDFTRVGAEVKAKGFRCLKTNIAIELDGKITAYRPGFVVGRGFPERNWDDFIARSAARTVEAFRKGCGPDVGIMLDTNFHFRTEGFRRIAEAVGPTRLTWLELDAHDPKSIALIRRDSPVPIASGETLLERRDFRPYFEAYAFDTAIVEVVWNGFYESLKIAAMADVYEVNVAPHNFYGHLASAMRRKPSVRKWKLVSSMMPTSGPQPLRKASTVFAALRAI